MAKLYPLDRFGSHPDLKGLARRAADPKTKPDEANGIYAFLAFASQFAADPVKAKVGWPIADLDQRIVPYALELGLARARNGFLVHDVREDTAPLSVRLPVDQIQKIRECALKRGVSVGVLVREALAQYV